MSSKKQAPKVEVVVAVIALIGTLGAALITGVFSNWDKLFPKSSPTPTPAPTMSMPVPSPKPPEEKIPSSQPSSLPPNPRPTSVRPSSPDLSGNPDLRKTIPQPQPPVLEPTSSPTIPQSQNWCDDPKINNEDKYRLGCPGF